MSAQTYGIHDLVAPLVYKSQDGLFKLNEMLRYQAMTFPSTDVRSIELGVYVNQISAAIFLLDKLLYSKLLSPVVTQEP